MTATISKVDVVPVAGHDSMLLNLSGAHGPFFTRNIAIVTDSEGRGGLGEVPGGEAIRQTIADAAAILVGQPLKRIRPTLVSSTGRSARAASVSASVAWTVAVSWPSSASSRGSRAATSSYLTTTPAAPKTSSVTVLSSIASSSAGAS